MKLGKQIEEFVGLRAKLYSFRTHDNEVKRAKGVKKSVIQKNIKMEEFKQVLFSGEQVHKTMNLIQNKDHILYTNEVNKIVLSAADDKRHILTPSALGYYLSTEP